MPRGSDTFNAAAAQDVVEDILFVRILNIPEKADPTKTISLYLTDASEVVSFFDENGYPRDYTPCGLSYEQAETSIDNTLDTVYVNLDNVNRDFSAYAQYYDVLDAEVHVLRGFRDTLDSVDGAQLIFVGFIQQAIINEHAIRISVWPDYTLKLKVPRRRYWVNLFPYLPASKDVRYVQRI